jgi:hypothetical protein
MEDLLAKQRATRKLPSIFSSLRTARWPWEPPELSERRRRQRCGSSTPSKNFQINASPPCNNLIAQKSNRGWFVFLETRSRWLDAA